MGSSGTLLPHVVAIKQSGSEWFVESALRLNVSDSWYFVWLFVNWCVCALSGLSLDDDEYECAGVLAGHSQDVKMVAFHPAREVPPTNPTPRSLHALSVSRITRSPFGHVCFFSSCTDVFFVCDRSSRRAATMTPSNCGRTTTVTIGCAWTRWPHINRRSGACVSTNRGHSSVCALHRPRF